MSAANCDTHLCCAFAVHPRTPTNPVVQLLAAFQSIFRRMLDAWLFTCPSQSSTHAVNDPCVVRYWRASDFYETVRDMMSKNDARTLIGYCCVQSNHCWAPWNPL